LALLWGSGVYVLPHARLCNCLIFAGRFRAAQTLTSDSRGVARIFGLGGRPCRVEPDPASTEVAKPTRGVWVLPQKNFADPNA